MDAWISQRADVLAEAGSVDRDVLELTTAEVDSLLDLAGLAAHDSAARTNAPLLCFLAGRACANDASLDELSAAVRSSTS